MHGNIRRLGTNEKTPNESLRFRVFFSSAGSIYGIIADDWTIEHCPFVDGVWLFAAGKQLSKRRAEIRSTRKVASFRAQSFLSQRLGTVVASRRVHSGAGSRGSRFDSTIVQVNTNSHRFLSFR